MHGGKSSTHKKKLAFFEIAKSAATDSGKNFDSTFHKETPMSRSRMLKDVSHHNTATNAIPKVRAEVRGKHNTVDLVHDSWQDVPMSCTCADAVRPGRWWVHKRFTSSALIGNVRMSRTEM